jgi:hypothetical protein
MLPMVTLYTNYGFHELFLKQFKSFGNCVMNINESIGFFPNIILFCFRLSIHIYFMKWWLFIASEVNKLIWL